MKKPDYSNDAFPVLDCRDGQDCQHLQFKTWSELGLRWNAYRERNLTGSSYGADMLPYLVDVAKAHGETIIAASLHNFGVSIAVLSPSQP